MSKSRFSYSIEIDHERHTVTVSDSINGHKSRCPIYLSCQANAYDVAQACRAAAFQLLERADGVEHPANFTIRQTSTRKSPPCSANTSRPSLDNSVRM